MSRRLLIVFVSLTVAAGVATFASERTGSKVSRRVAADPTSIPTSIPSTSPTPAPAPTSPGDTICSPSIEETAAKILQASSCGEAAQMADACAYGSSADLEIAGAAIQVCEKDLKEISEKDAQLREAMETRCDEAYAHQEGTLYLSVNQFCHLNAVRFISGFYDEESDDSSEDVVQ